MRPSAEVRTSNDCSDTEPNRMGRTSPRRIDRHPSVPDLASMHQQIPERFPAIGSMVFPEDRRPSHTPIDQFQHMSAIPSLQTTIAVSIIAAASYAGQAQSWVNVYDPAHGGIAGRSGDLGTDTAGNLYAVGSTLQSADGSMRAVLLGSGDQGTTWNVLNQYAETGLNYVHYRAFAWNPASGSLFTGGNLNNLLPGGTYEYNTLWLIREWNPITGMWATVDDAADLVGDIGQASCADILVTPSGDVYAAGGGDLGPVIRKRRAGTSAFATVHADYSGRTTGTGWDLGFHSSHGVFEVGDEKGIWTVRRSSTGDTGTWVVVDSFYSPREWTSGSAKSVFLSSAKLHVVGSAYNASTRKNHWVVRTSSDGGQSWSIADMALTGSSVEARGIVEDPAGNLIVCGQVAGAAGDLHWIVRKGVPGTKLVKQGKQWVQVATINWSTSDDFQLVPGRSAVPNAIATDSHGNIYVSGHAQDVNGVDQWIVRKLTP